MAWNPKKDQGHGICGAKNIYSTTVRIDNWTEDLAGNRLVRENRTGIRNFETETSRNYCSYDQRPLPSDTSSKAQTSTDLVKSKEGLSYPLIFNHGTTEISTQERFSTMANKLNPTESAYSQPNNALLKEKIKQIKREANLTKFMTTEHTKQTFFTSDPTTSNASMVSTIRGEIADLPNVSKSSRFSSTFGQSFR